jgi:glycosyltransferase involved in cell wall biosynthesis
VIVPDAGGAGSLVEDGVTGLRFRANDVDDLRRVLLKARRLSPEALQQMVDRASQVLRRRFSPAEGMKRYREALRLES